MADDGKVVSDGAVMSDGNVISMVGRKRAKPAPAEPAPAAAPESTDTKPVPTQLVWLFCPVCKTLEYTELAVPGGRRHNTCGTPVIEARVDVDARAEHTLAELNLRRLSALAELLDAQRKRFHEYQDRLAKAAGRTLAPYPLTEVSVQSLPVAEVDPLGLLISRFLHQPAERFVEDKPPGDKPPGARPETTLPAGEDPSTGG
jgi:hypothetical protein